MRRKIIVVLAVVLAGLGTAIFLRNTPAPAETWQVTKRIAHAGGGFKSLTYTNSLDALDANAERYDLFEIDFSFTKDGQLVCIHDWHGSAAAAFGVKLHSAPTLEEFQKLVSDSIKFKNCTLDTLVAWLEAHPTKKIVTDVKDDNLRALTLIAQRVPRYSMTFIPQIYRPEEYERVRQLGYSTIIWTLYRYSGNAEMIIEAARNMRPYAITMPREHADTGLARTIGQRLGIPSYVHTINTEGDVARYRSLGVSNIYTDWLPE